MVIVVGLICDLSRFSSRFDLIFSGEHLIQFIANKMQDFRNFVLHNCILIFDDGQFYSKPQVSNFKNKAVAALPYPQTLSKIDFLKALSPKSSALDPKHQIDIKQ